ncbi:MAG: hypothetical protein K1X72_10845 [Pyrinomonadaceae bacterium]|nr:hypothetical protein [Pyrinomonadaceae bacterium]
MSKVIIFSFLTVLILANIVRADIPPPPVADSIRIELNLVSRDDYQFYLCSYKLNVVPNPNPPHPSRPNMIVTVPDSFQMKKIELSGSNPYSETLGSGRIQYRGSYYDKSLYLVAIKKSRVDELEPKIKEAIDNNKSGDYSIRFVRLETSLEIRSDEGKGAKVVVNKVSLDEKDMILTVEEGKVSSVSGKASNCIGLGLLFAGFALISGWFVKRKYN